MGKIKATTDGKKGGILYGKSHAQGGIKAVVTDAGNKEVELEGGEAVVKKSALKDKTVKTLTGTNAQILNLINTRAGGNPIYAPSEVKMKNGGRVGNGGKLGVLTTSDNIKVSGFNHYQKTKKNGNFYKVFAEKNINNNRFELWWIFFTIKDGVKKLGTIRYRFENEKKDINKEYIISFDDLPSSLKEVYNNISETYKEGGNPIYAPSEVKMAKGGLIGDDCFSMPKNTDEERRAYAECILKGLDYRYSSNSHTDYGHSMYFKVGDIKVRFSDHSVTNRERMNEEAHFNWHGKKPMVEQSLLRLKYLLGDENVVYKKIKLEMPSGNIRDVFGFEYVNEMAKGGSIEDNCISFIKNSEAIKNNGYFHYFKNISIYADFGTKVPKTKSFYLCAYNSGGQKNLKVTDTLNLDLINKLQEIIDCEKSICRIIVDEFFRKAKRIESNDLSRMTGENIIVVDRYNIVCDNIKNEFSSGGSITPSAINNMTKAEQKAFYKTKEGKELDKQTYTKWKSLVNMSKGELESFYNSKEGKEAGLSASEAKAEGIDSGRESARWIMKMKDIPYTEWTSNMWVWAKKQISFVSRMKGMRGDLYDDKGNKTRKHLALLIWGHNPKKMAEGGVIPQQGTLFTKDKKNKLDYKKVGNDYVFKVYDVESNPVENYTRHQYKKRNNNEATMDYNQFINYLYSEHYIDDKKMAEGGSINNMTKAEWIIDGKESTREDFQEIYQRALSNSDDGIYNLNAKKVEYLGDEEQAIKEIKDYNRITDIYTKNGELKRHYMEAVISKAFNEISFRKFGNAFRKNIDESFSQERKKESLMNTKMSWLELASYIIGDVGYYLRSENDFRAFAKELGIDIPKNKTNDADIEMGEGGVTGDVFSIKDPEQFKQLITLYNKFSEKFDVDNYFVDDSSVVFLRKVKFTDAELKGMAQYIADLSKNQNFSIISDKKPEISNGYFKFFLKERVRYEDGGNVSQLKKGIEVEQEHKETLNKLKKGIISVKEAIKETAEEHISENPKYYDELEKIEGGNKNKEVSNNDVTEIKNKFNFLIGILDQKGLSESFEKLYNRLYVDSKQGILYNKVKLENEARKCGVESANDAKEVAEFTIVNLAREISLGEGSTKEKYDRIVELYKNQVNLSHRTSESIMYQQYSTPAPLGYLMGIYCGMDNKGKYFEPSAGNGLLTISSNPQNFNVNEIDDVRNTNLSVQGFNRVTKIDASLPFVGLEKSFDAIITNPPFGTTETVMYGDSQIKSLEQVMALRALDTMKDNGRAAIIIGGHTLYDKEGRIQAGKNRTFFVYLYKNYYVEDVINIDGHNLYSRQGTAFNTRIILINGRKINPSGFPPLVKDKTPSTENHSSQMVSSFDDLFERVMNLK